MIVSWLSPCQDGIYAYETDQEIEKALNDYGYDVKTARQLMHDGRMVWHRSVNNQTNEDINTIYLDGRELFQIIGQCWSGGPLWGKWVLKRIDNKE